MTPRLALFLILGIDAAVLFYEASSLSLTYHGATLLYGDMPTVMTRIIRFFVSVFGHNDIALRFPMIVMNLLSALLLYVLAGPYAKNDRERVWLVAVFLLLPGIISASLLVDSAALVTLALLAYACARRRWGHWADLLLPLYLFADPAFLVLYAGTFLYALHRRAWPFAGGYALMFGVSLWYFGFDTGGLPESQFLDTLGLFAAVMSPIVFVYLVYVLYRRWVTKQTDLLWYLSATALVLALLLSFRQRIEIERFAPYLMLALPLGMQTFYHSYRVRLRPFRKRYRILFTLAVATLVLNAFAVFFNKAAYPFLDEPSHYFAYRAHIARELAEALREKGISCVDTESRMQLRLRFYGIGRCDGVVLKPAGDESRADVTIRYYNTPVARYSVTRIPTD